MSTSQHVLLLVDVQSGMLEDPLNSVPSSQSIRYNIERILAQARKAIPPPLIIHVRNTGDVGDSDEPNTPGWQLVFPPLEHEPVIDKLENNAFAGTKLSDLISTDAEIIVVGMQSEFCIRATCSAALERGNKVMLIRGAHATYDQVEDGTTPASEIEAGIEAELAKAGVMLLEVKDLVGVGS